MGETVTDYANAETAEAGLAEAAETRAGTRHQSAVEASESRYRRLFESAKDGILILNGDTGQVVDVNPFLTELTGHSHTYFLGKHLWEIGAFKDIAASRAAFANLQAKTYVRYEDLPLVANDGRRLDVEFVSNVYRVDNENVIQCNIRDVATRRRAERRTLEERACLNAILESSEAPIFAVDSKYRYTAFNQAYAIEMRSIHGVDVRVGDQVVAFQSTAWLATKESLDRALRGETVVELVDLVCDGRSLRHLETAHYPIRSAAAEIIGVAVFTRDVTERKEADDELLFRNLILSTQLDTSIDGIQVVNALGRTISSNQRFADMWGIAPDGIESVSDQHLLQSMLERLVNPEEFEHTLEHLLTAPDEESRNDICLKDGRTFDCFSAPMLNAAREFFGRLWQFRDITARVEAEKAHARLEEQLRASQKLEAIGSLTGGIAHDFNNLLSVILNYATFVKEGLPENHPVLNDLLEVQKAAERATALTRSLLAFGRKQVLQPVTLNLNMIVLGMETMLRSVVGEGIEVCVALASDLGLARADPSQIEQVLMNLVTNARDAMRSGGKLTIETGNAEISEDSAAGHMSMVSGSYVVLAVTDTGCGMDEQTKTRIFEPFFTTKENGKGTGLGLASVFGIVKQSGGNIWVDSEPGHGTTLKVHLPLSTSGTIPPPCNPSTLPPRSRYRGTETILVVEDEDALRQIAIRTLKATGYRVMAAANGEEALLTAAQYGGDIHLLLTDVIMPGINGRMLALELKKTRPALEILYMSGYTDSALGKRGVLDRGMHFLAKPFVAVDLARKVKTVLNG